MNNKSWEEIAKASFSEMPVNFMLLSNFEIISKIKKNNITEDDFIKWLNGVDKFKMLPSYESLVARELKSCPSCASLVYSNYGDVKVLSMADIFRFHYKKFKKSQEGNLFSSIFAVFDNKQVKENILENIENHKKNLNNEKTNIPLIHICNSCNFGWPIYFDVKCNLPARYYFNNKKKLFDLDGLLNGLILLEVREEIQFIKDHIERVKKVIDKSIDNFINLGKRLELGDTETAIELLFKITESDIFFHQTAIVIKSRYSVLNRSNQMGVLSRENYLKEIEEVNRSIIELITTIKQYKRFQ